MPKVVVALMPSNYPERKLIFVNWVGFKSSWEETTCQYFLHTVKEKKGLFICEKFFCPAVKDLRKSQDLKMNPDKRRHSIQSGFTSI